jgi:translation initiation factor IF-2
VAVGEGAAGVPRVRPAGAGRGRSRHRLPVVHGGPADGRRHHPAPAPARPAARRGAVGARRPRSRGDPQGAGRARRRAGGAAGIDAARHRRADPGGGGAVLPHAGPPALPSGGDGAGVRRHGGRGRVGAVPAAGAPAPGGGGGRERCRRRRRLRRLLPAPPRRGRPGGGRLPAGAGDAAAAGAVALGRRAGGRAGRLRRGGALAPRGLRHPRGHLPRARGLGGANAEPTGDAVREHYLVGPADTDDPDDYRTELRWPVAIA